MSIYYLCFKYNLIVCLHNLIFNNGCLKTSSKISETSKVSFLELAPAHCCYFHTHFLERETEAQEDVQTDRGRA